MQINSGLNGEGRKLGSLVAVFGVLATGFVEVLWTFNRVSRLLGRLPIDKFSWETLLETDSVFHREAFVSTVSKGTDQGTTKLTPRLSNSPLLAISRFMILYGDRAAS